jgi:FtsH-binding integral membrane protein
MFHRHPVNLLFLAAFTVCMAFLVGMITAFFDFEAVLLAFLTTAAAVAVLTAIAMVGVRQGEPKPAPLMLLGVTSHL